MNRPPRSASTLRRAYPLALAALAAGAVLRNEWLVVGAVTFVTVGVAAQGLRLARGGPAVQHRDRRRVVAVGLALVVLAAAVEVAVLLEAVLRDA